ncbi:MAG: hypothetical protein ABJ308_01775 [Halieaceae bacterium]
MKKVYALAALILLISGCKVSVHVPDGGRVVATSGAMNCTTGKICEMDIADIHFHQTFRAVPNEGWEFAGWTDRSLLCDKSKTDCTISTRGMDYDNPAVRNLLSDQSQRVILEPRFRKKPAQKPQYPNVAGRYFQEIDSFGLDCAYPLGYIRADADYSYVTVTQKGKALKFKSERAPDPNIVFSKSWDGNFSIDQTGKFYKNFSEAYTVKTVDGKIKVTESSQISGRFSNGYYQLTRITQANLVPQRGPYKGKSISCSTAPVRITGERI